MIQINRSADNQFHTVTTGDNNEPLHNSETEKQKASIFKNLIAAAKQFRCQDYIIVVDQTGKKDVKWMVFLTGKKVKL